MWIVRMALRAAEQAQDAVEEGCLSLVILVAGVAAVGFAVVHLWV